ncbi:MAG: class I adenylate-forming enzyme family protein [Mycobacterium sp.]
MSDLTVDAVVRRHAANSPAQAMVVDPAGSLDYRELDTTTRILAATLITSGIGKGSRVGLIMGNSVDWVRFAIALTRIGAVLVPLSTLLRAGELVAQLQAASVQHLIAVDEFRGHRYLDDLRAVPRTALPALQRISTPEALTTHSVDLSFVDALAATVRPSDPMAVMFTSGSSGAPKGVVHTHGNALGAVRSGLTARCITQETRLYLPMPFFWVGGFGAGVLATLVAGATLVTEPVPGPESTLRLLEREKVTLFRGWPEQADALARRADVVGADLSSLRPGSLEALLPQELRAEPGARAKLFGMTESFGPYCGFPADTDMPRSAWGSCGQPFPGMTVRIVDTDSGQPLPTGAVGVIQIRGPHVMQGICRRHRGEVFTADGFYPTGDLGYLDADGFLFYQGRSDDMFKVSGATVYPGEVEQALRTLPGVSGAFVTNIAGPRVGAVVVCDTAHVTVESLRAAARSVLSSFKVPTVWSLLDDEDAVPRGSTGKVDIPRLRALLREREGQLESEEQ